MRKLYLYISAVGLMLFIQGVYGGSTPWIGGATASNVSPATGARHGYVQNFLKYPVLVILQVHKEGWIFSQGTYSGTEKPVVAVVKAAQEKAKVHILDTKDWHYRIGRPGMNVLIRVLKDDDPFFGGLNEAFEGNDSVSLGELAKMDDELLRKALEKYKIRIKGVSDSDMVSKAELKKDYLTALVGQMQDMTDTERALFEVEDAENFFSYVFPKVKKDNVYVRHVKKIEHGVNQGLTFSYNWVTRGQQGWEFEIKPYEGGKEGDLMKKAEDIFSGAKYNRDKEDDPEETFTFDDWNTESKKHRPESETSRNDSFEWN